MSGYEATGMLDPGIKFSRGAEPAIPGNPAEMVLGKAVLGFYSSPNW